MPKVQAKFDELNKTALNGSELTAEQKQEFIELHQAAQTADGSPLADPGANWR